MAKERAEKRLSRGFSRQGAKDAKNGQVRRGIPADIPDEDKVILDLVLIETVNNMHKKQETKESLRR
jgi:hypothetical protein